MSNLVNSQWKEKYRPSALEEYVGTNEVKSKIQSWLDSQDIPDLLFAGSAGTGKTTIAKIIGKHLDADILYINASAENSVDVIRDKITKFAATAGFSKWKLVILDEADFLTQNAQAALRNVIETFSKTTRFILTCNYVERIIDPIQSRLMLFNVYPPDKKSVAIRVKQILDLENIKYEVKDLGAIVNQYYPDQRKIISALQRNSVTGTLIIEDSVRMISEYCDKILEVLKAKKDAKIAFTEIRQIIADSKVKMFDDLFSYLFEHVDEIAPAGKKANIIMHISEYQYRSTFVIDKEIQVSAMILNILQEIYAK